MSTIYDVARLAKVSPATVSRVLNGVRTSPKSTQAVLAAVEKLGFVPNRNAQRLRTRESELIAMLIPDIENRFYTKMVRAVEDTARAEGYAVMLCNTDDDPVKEAEYLDAVIREPVAGIISAPANDATSFSLARLRRVPVVTVDRRARTEEFDSVIIDNVTGVESGIGLLAARGYRRIACITGPEGIETADDRAEGWRRGVWNLTGRMPEPNFLERTSFSFEGGAQAVETLLRLPEPPDAIFAANNRLAVGAIRELHSRGYTDGQIGMLSFGELWFMLDLPKGVIVADLPEYGMGMIAARMLLERIKGDGSPVRRVVLPPTIADSAESSESPADRVVVPLRKGSA
ncbi:MAG: LacI family DNA-binding transcriptional regulator [Bowdeniella nasicola]|nr:LacI family DNA-binding transcriptional regulator [Bowdeniella nasicola]